MLNPGLLQTPSYAESLIRAAYPDNESSDIGRRVQMRLHRQKLATRERRPTRMAALLDEQILHRIVGSPAIMAQQLKHLADIGTRDNVESEWCPSLRVSRSVTLQARSPSSTSTRARKQARTIGRLRRQLHR
ncbi:Scr1 family TA system antitoxin-like transcriptional regulator [Nocardia sp. NPDC057353]|uniref:Scr1 family TA system antitoxin-like transcriptional regulator n=1 Tax=Nocardia sp. NPDC057353 TaxID=3346104 RepID=UPI00362FC15C